MKKNIETTVAAVMFCVSILILFYGLMEISYMVMPHHEI